MIATILFVVGLFAVGLVLIVEGLAWWLAPSFVERMLAALRDLSVSVRRQIGLLAAVIGLILVLTAHQLGLSIGR